MSEKFWFFLGTLLIFVVLQRIFPLLHNHRRGVKFFYWTITHFVFISLGNGLIFLARKVPILMGLYHLNSTWLLAEIENSIFSYCLAILILDFALYWQHRFIHKINFLWRIHLVHHSDKNMEVSTGFRFHPLEIFLSSFYKLSVAFVFGISLEQYIVFEFIVLLGTLFSHSNLLLNKKLNRCLGLLIITPEIHFVHHSQKYREMNSNFGFFLSLWDRVFGTLNILSLDEVQQLKLGVKGHEPQNIHDLVLSPFKK